MRGTEAFYRNLTLWMFSADKHTIKEVPKGDLL